MDKTKKLVKQFMISAFPFCH